MTGHGGAPAGGGDRGSSSSARPPRGVFGGTAWSVGRISGIELAIDHSWVLIFALITVSLGGSFATENPDRGPLAAWGAALVSSVLFFASSVLHELGHSLAAQRFGLRVRSITLFVFVRMAERNVDQLPVVASGRLLGALTRERLIALVQASLALEGEERRRL